LNGFTHVAGGALAGCAIVYFTNASEQLPVILTAAAIGALVPDIDNPHSTIQKYVPGVGKILGHLLTHRGVTHSLVFAGLLTLVLNMISLPWNIAIAFIAGIISHLILDTLNPMGVPWLWPLPGRFSIPLVKSSCLAERFFFMPLMLALAAYSVYITYF